MLSLEGCEQSILGILLFGVLMLTMHGDRLVCLGVRIQYLNEITMLGHCTP